MFLSFACRRLRAPTILAATALLAIVYLWFVLCAQVRGGLSLLASLLHKRVHGLRLGCCLFWLDW